MNEVMNEVTNQATDDYPNEATDDNARSHAYVEQVLSILIMLAKIGNNTKGLQLKHVLQGVEGYADFVFPYIFHCLRVQANGTLKYGDNIAQLVFKVLKERSIKIAESHLPTLFGRREDIAMDDTDTLARIDCEILHLQQLADDYEDFFGKESFKLLHRLLIQKLMQRLRSYAAEQKQCEQLQHEHQHEQQQNLKRKNSTLAPTVKRAKK